jgi:hypothetical protein
MKKKYALLILSAKKWQLYHRELLKTNFFVLIFISLFFSIHPFLLPAQNGVNNKQNYHITQDITIDGELKIFPGYYLIIDPGVKVKFIDNNSKIVVQGGSITAIGTETQTIRFYSDNDEGWGGIEILFSDAVFEYCEFNKISHSGKINSVGAGFLKFSHCLFKSNNGGIRINYSDITIEESLFVRNEIDPTKYGENALIHVDESSVNILNNQFLFNKTTHKGIISISGTIDARINGNTFRFNKWFAEDSPPTTDYNIMYFNGSPSYQNRLIIMNNLFKSNNDAIGDICDIFIAGGDNQKPENCIVLFRTNEFYGTTTNTFKKQATSVRGASLIASKNIFANYNRNAIKINQSVAKLQINTFIKNYDLEAVHFMKSNDYFGTTKLTNELNANTFEQNTGGAVKSLIDNEDIELILRLNIFENNNANSGSAIFAKDNKNLRILSNSFAENSAETNGGALFIENSSVNAADNNFTGNNAQNGGALFIENSSVNAADNNFTGNNAQNGGAIYAIGLSTSTFTDNVINNNSYQSNGGGLFIDNCSNLMLKRNLIASNKNIGVTTSGKGAGLYVENSNLQIYNCNFFFNDFDIINGERDRAIWFELNKSNTLSFVNNNISFNLNQGGINFETEVNTANIHIHNNIFYANGQASNYLYYKRKFNNGNVDPINIHFCYFDRKIPFGNSSCNVLPNPFPPLTKQLPGWISSTDHRLKCTESVCVDAGNDDSDFNDVNFDISCNTDTNDIGITGGPHALNKSHLFNPFTGLFYKPYFFAEVISHENKTIKIHDHSMINCSGLSNSSNYHQWIFGDGNCSERAKYSENEGFTYTYDEHIEKATIMLVFENDDGKQFYSQTVTFNPMPDKTENKPVQTDLTNGATDLQTIIAEDLFHIYPNPTGGVVNLRYGFNDNKPLQVLVSDIYGAVVHLSHHAPASKQSEISFDLSKHKPGIYFLKIRSGNHYGIKKIILN